MVKNGIFIRNYQEISKLNNNILRQTSFISSIIFAVLFIISIIAPGWGFLMPLYGISSIVSLTVYLLSKFVTPKHINLVLPIVYIFFIYSFVSAIYLGIFNSPKTVAVTFICLLLIIPTLFLDKQWRINITIIFISVVFCILTFIYKPLFLAVDDITDCIVFCIIGIYIGQVMRSVRLDNIEMQRKLTKQRDTDMLTTLSNRRKLFETIELWESNHSLKSLSTVIMIDIDNFKSYNDYYGHQKGDECLKKLGKCFSSFIKHYGLEIFRYGGEEFMSIGEIYDYETIRAISQHLLKSVQDLQIPFDHSPTGFITISIGFAGNNTYNWEELIHMADLSLYRAKDLGRNRVIGYLD